MPVMDESSSSGFSQRASCWPTLLSEVDLLSP